MADDFESSPETIEPQSDEITPPLGDENILPPETEASAPAETTNNEHDLDWLIQRGTELENENARLRQDVDRYSRSAQPPTTAAATKQAESTNPRQPGEAREDWEERIEKIVERRLADAIKPITEYTQRQAERAELGDVERKTGEVVQGVQRLAGYYAKNAPYLKERPKVAERIAKQVETEMKQWRSANGRAADRSGQVIDYFDMQSKRFQQLIAEYEWHHGVMQGEQATTAQQRAPGARQPSSGGSSRPATTKSGDGKNRNHALGSPEDIEDDKDWLRRNGSRFGIKKL